GEGAGGRDRTGHTAVGAGCPRRVGWAKVAGGDRAHQCFICWRGSRWVTRRYAALTHPTASPARGAPEGVFKDDAIGELRIAQVQLDDQVAARADSGGKREVPFAVADLLMGDFDPAAIAQDRLHGEDSDLGKFAGERLPGRVARNDEYGKKHF